MAKNTKISAIKTYPLEVPLDRPWAYSQCWRHTRWSLFVQVSTEDGFVGWGEGEYAPTSSADAIHSQYADIFLGQDPFDVRALWERAYNYTRDYGRTGVTMIALSALETALYDLCGKILGVSVSTLLGGGFRTRVPVYLTGGYPHDLSRIVEEVVDESRRKVDQGAGALKLKVGFGVDLDTELIHAVRNAVGPSVRIMMDANRAYTAAEAIQLSKRVQDCRIYWFEEPVVPEDLEGYREVRARTEIPVAGGEEEYTRWGFRRLLESGAVDIVQPSVAMAGGVGECRNIAYLASAFNTRCVPHSWGLGINTAATLQLLSAMPQYPPRLIEDPPMLEVDSSASSLRDEALVDGPVIKDGFAYLPENPGIGAVVNQSAVERIASPIRESSL